MGMRTVKHVGMHVMVLIGLPTVQSAVLLSEVTRSAFCEGPSRLLSPATLPSPKSLLEAGTLYTHFTAGSTRKRMLFPSGIEPPYVRAPLGLSLGFPISSLEVIT